MREFILVLLLAFVSSSAMAGWVLVGSNEPANLMIYADPDTIHRTGNIVSMWNILDFSAIQRSAGSTAFLATTYLSVKAHHEYDCKKIFNGCLPTIGIQRTWATVLWCLAMRQ
jgi:hypothetical protein